MQLAASEDPGTEKARSTRDATRGPGGPPGTSPRAGRGTRGRPLSLAVFSVAAARPGGSDQPVGDRGPEQLNFALRIQLLR
eukprot:14380828-Alexandrium_andersonii.AAC.1